jgi:hypothetical protein
MLTLQERKDNYQSYIKSAHFGIDTWRTLFIFQSNFESIKNTITLYLLLEKGLWMVNYHTLILSIYYE